MPEAPAGNARSAEALRRPGRDERRHAGYRSRRNPRADRPERRGQDDAGCAACRRVGAGCRHSSSSAALTSRRRTPGGTGRTGARAVVPDHHDLPGVLGAGRMWRSRCRPAAGTVSGSGEPARRDRIVARTGAALAGRGGVGRPRRRPGRDTVARREARAGAGDGTGDRATPAAAGRTDGRHRADDAARMVAVAGGV